MNSEYEELNNISSSDDTTISVIYYPKLDCYACKKQIFILDDLSRRKSYREINTLSFLKNNPNCIHLYETLELNDTPKPSIVLITEYCERGNLLELGQYFKQQNQNFDRYIVYYIKKSIKFLSKLQSQKISHRDIKPENIFISSSGDIKFGDFGSSTSTLGSKKFTIQGSPYYLSPELQSGYYKYIHEGGDSKIIHCPHLSDVYSLGLIFLYLCTLEPIDERFCELETLEENIRNYTEKIQNQYLKRIISWMLKFRSNERPDFITLEQDLLENNLFQCYRCGLYESDYWFSCDNCYRDFHTYCTSSNICQFCQGELKPYQKTYKNRPEDHALNSSYSNYINAFNDLTVFDNNERTLNISLFPKNIVCFKCENDCVLGQNSYFCYRCKIEFCRKCKRGNHSGICSHIEVGKFVVCNCRSLVKEHYFNDIFFLCKKCGYNCIVCLKNIKYSHSDCSFMIGN